MILTEKEHLEYLLEEIKGGSCLVDILIMIKQQLTKFSQKILGGNNE